METVFEISTHTSQIYCICIFVSERVEKNKFNEEVDVSNLLVVFVE